MAYFAGAGKKEGIEVWRIEKLEAARWDEPGKFYGGDAYIVLQTKKKGNSFEWHIFFWLGATCSQDESGVAAYKTVELDDLLGGAPVQHREVQGYESDQFLSLFPNMQILEGGIESGFNHVEPENYQPRLFHLKGKRHVRVSQVALSGDSLNDGDVFLLDLGLTLYQFNGKEANKYEKTKGLELLLQIKDNERGGRPKFEIIESDAAGAEAEAFWAALGGKKKIASAQDGGSDDEIKAAETQLYNAADLSHIASGRLEKEALDTNNTYLIDTGNEVFVWIGKKASKDARAGAILAAQNFIKDQGRPAHTSVTKVSETGEPANFKGLFLKWDAPKKAGAAAKVAAADDVSALYKANQAEEEKNIDDGTGEVTIWRVENFDKVAVPADQYGQFFSGDSYVLLYAYRAQNRPAWIIYFWQGRDSSTDEKGASALLAKDLDDQYRGEPVQVRVVQGKEPTHFLNLFKGRMVVHNGGVASGFANRAQAAVEADNRLYHVRGTTETNTRAVEVTATATSLNSGDDFILLTPDTSFLWLGKGANAVEHETSRKLAKIVQGKRGETVVNEGEESEAFWSALGGKADYPSEREMQEGAAEPRLFHGSNVSGSFKMVEVFNFSQEDLCNDDVFLLDTVKEVFVWIGPESNKAEQDGIFTAALEYVKNAPDGRSPDTAVYRVRSGAEPPIFTCHFLGWNHVNPDAGFQDPYAKKLAELKLVGQAVPEHKEAHAPKAAAAAAAVAPAALDRVSNEDVGYLDADKNKYSFEELKNKVAGIDNSKREQYLSDADFAKHFGTSRAEFNAMAQWKKDAAKKKVGLF